MRNKKILQYRKDGKLSYLQLSENRDEHGIQKLKRDLKGSDYRINDHTIKESHKFYGKYLLELDNCGYIYLKGDDVGKTTVVNKTHEVSNLLASIKKYQTNIKKVINKMLNINGGDLMLTAGVKKLRIWKRILTDIGYVVKESRGHYGRKILIISK